MRSQAEIRLNYERAIRQAERLETLSARMRRMADDDMEGLLGEVYRAWTGESATRYIQKGQRAETNLRTIADNLKKNAESIRLIAEQVRAAELEARRIASEHG